MVVHRMRFIISLNMMAKISNTANTCKSSAGVATKYRSNRGASLDTLAQLRKSSNYRGSEDKTILKSTTRVDDIKSLKKRAKRKYFGQALTYGLVDAAKNNPDSVLDKSYWNTYHCSSELTLMSDGRLSARFCKNRWCMVCAAIKIAQSINKYKEIIDSWDDKQFVTLTIVNPDKFNLEKEMVKMYETFVKIKDVMRKRYNNGQLEKKFIGLRKLESTYNSFSNTYHPHFHFIIEGRENAEFLVKRWLHHYPSSDSKGQDCRAADDNSTVELFKYFAKVISKGNAKHSSAIFADAMDVIFNAVKGKRTFQPFGFKAKKSIVENVCEDEKAYAVGVREWVQSLGDWVDEDTGEMLTGYIPGDSIKDLVTNKIIVRENYHSPIINKNTS